MSDIGGLQNILLSFSMGLLVLLNYNNFDSYLASRLYKIQDNSDGQIDNIKASSSIEPTKWCNVYEFILDAIPGCLKCKKCKCKKTRKMESREQARALMNEEINIVDIIKSRRYFKMALRLLLSK